MPEFGAALGSCHKAAVAAPRWRHPHREHLQVGTTLTKSQCRSPVGAQPLQLLDKSGEAKGTRPLLSARLTLVALPCRAPPPLKLAPVAAAVYTGPLHAEGVSPRRDGLHGASSCECSPVAWHARHDAQQGADVLGRVRRRRPSVTFSPEGRPSLQRQLEARDTHGRGARWTLRADRRLLRVRPRARLA